MKFAEMMFGGVVKKTGQKVQAEVKKLSTEYGEGVLQSLKRRWLAHSSVKPHVVDEVVQPKPLLRVYKPSRRRYHTQTTAKRFNIPPMAQYAAVAATHDMWKHADQKRYYSSTPHPYHNPTEISKEVEIRFEEVVVTTIRNHKAYNHPFFKQIEESIEAEQFSADHMALLSQVMYRYSHDTIPALARGIKWGFLQGDYEAASTFLESLKHETGDGKIQAMHPLLMERALNALRSYVFKLPPLSMIDATKMKHFAEEKTFRLVMSKFLEDNPVLALFVHEAIMHGENKPENRGFMGDFYRVFVAYAGEIDHHAYHRDILPYFEEHITLSPDGNHHQLFGEEAVKDQFLTRLRADFMRQFKTVEDVDAIESSIITILDAHDALFTKFQERFEGLKQQVAQGKVKQAAKVLHTKSSHSLHLHTSSILVSERLDEIVEAVIKPHSVSNHELFRYLEKQAKAGKLTPEQFEVYRDVMLRRVYPTVPAIATLIEWAFVHGDYQTAKTAVHNMKEEGAEGIVPSMHPLLMERAYNAMGKQLGLPPQTMLTASKQHLWSEEAAFAAIMEECYKTNPVVASFVQEFLSGGDNTLNNRGMMGDMYRLFRAYMPNMPLEDFKRDVLPYFEAHITVKDGSYEQGFGGNAVEHQHGVRAKKDVLRRVKTPEELDAMIPVMQAFMEAQSALFSRILKEVKALAKDKEPQEGAHASKLKRSGSSKGPQL